MKKLSIIIPVYNCNEYTNKLLDILNNQITEEVEVLVIDDGSKIPYTSEYKWAKIIRKENGGASSARNLGISLSKGKYLAFIDGDDEVPSYYVEKIIRKIDEEKFDYCYLSWNTIGSGWKHEKILKSIDDEFDTWNLCVWNRIWRKAPIKDIRFNENKAIAEDAQFIKDTKPLLNKKSFISDIMYNYRSDTPDSLTKRFSQGKLKMRRIIYNFNKITNDMTYLIDEIRALNEECEVIIMTNKNELSELNKYAMITTPMSIKGTELRGEKTNLFSKIELNQDYDVIIWTQETFIIGGIETFIYDWCMNMKSYYNILVLYDKMAQSQIDRLKDHVQVEKINYNKRYKCNNLIINRISDNKPRNIDAGKVIGMVHGCKLIASWRIPKERDVHIPVSNVVKRSFSDEFNTEPIVIHNFTYPEEKHKRALRLISATRLSFEKGEQRIINLAKLLRANNVPFVWTIFSEAKLREHVDGIVYLEPTLNIKDYIASSDYMVALSDSEAFGYSIVESLEMGVPVLTTPIEVLNEIGFIDGVNGYIIPYNVSNIDLNLIVNHIPKFEYTNNNSDIKSKWDKVLSMEKPKKKHTVLENNMVRIKVKVGYFSVELNRDVNPNEILITTIERAEQIEAQGWCEIL